MYNIKLLEPIHIVYLKTRSCNPQTDLICNRSCNPKMDFMCSMNIKVLQPIHTVYLEVRICNPQSDFICSINIRVLQPIHIICRSGVATHKLTSYVMHHTQVLQPGHIVYLLIRSFNSETVNMGCIATKSCSPYTMFICRLGVANSQMDLMSSMKIKVFQPIHTAYM